MRSPVAVGKRVRTLRELSEFNQSEMSRICGFPRSAFGLIESGRRGDLGMSTLAILAKTFNVSLDWLVLENGEPPSREQVWVGIERMRLHPNEVRREVELALTMVLKGRAKALPRRALPASEARS